MVEAFRQFISLIYLKKLRGLLNGGKRNPVNSIPQRANRTEMFAGTFFNFFRLFAGLMCVLMNIKTLTHKERLDLFFSWNAFLYKLKASGIRPS